MTKNKKYLLLFFLSIIFFIDIFFVKTKVSQAYCCMPSCTDSIVVQENGRNIASCQSSDDHINYNYDSCSKNPECQSVNNDSNNNSDNNNSGGLVNGGLVPCGRNHDDGNPDNGDETAPCTLCHLVIGVQRIIQWLMHLITYIAIAALVAAGIFYIVSAGNEKMLEMAKGYIKAILTGFAVALAGWVLINYTLYLFSTTSQEGGFVRGLTSGQHWWEFYCDTTSDLGSRTGNIPGTGGTATGGGGGAGTCSPLNSGSCSLTNLQQTCFGQNASKASAICSQESGGHSIPSGVDKCVPGGEPVSFGLFQINISANSIAGLDCPRAFDKTYTASNHNCSIINNDLYEKCKQAALNPVYNIQKACKLSNNGNVWNLWGANRICRF